MWIFTLSRCRPYVAGAHQQGEKAFGHMVSRSELETPTTWQTRPAQYDAVSTR
jgi:hypothetical protein